VLGIDTESIVGQTKFTQESGAALIQVATDKTIYLIDGFNAKSKVIAETFKTALSKAIIVGHSFTNDAEVMAKAFGF
jgi:ribonuclease D